MTQNKKPAVCWTKYIDPMNRNIDEVEYPGHHCPPLPGENIQIDYLSSDGNLQLENADEHSHKFHVPNPVRIANTPHGLMTLTEHSFASQYFDFWVIHCNFDITDDVAMAIELSPGVESITVLTRYRARLGFNRPLLQSGAFNISDIKLGVAVAAIGADNKKYVSSDIEELLLFDSHTRDIVNETKQRLSDNKYWAIYVLPNGKMETFSEPVQTGLFDDKLTLFKQTKELVGGGIFMS